MRMEKNSWALAVTIFSTQIAILIVVMAVWRTVAPHSQLTGQIIVDVLLSGFASALITKKFSA